MTPPNPIQWFRRRPLLTAYLLIGFVAAGALAGIRAEASERRDDLCEQFNRQQAVIHELVDVATTPTGGALNLSGIPEFQALDDDTQAWVRALEQASRARAQDDDDTTTVSEALLEFAARRLQPADC